MDKSSILRFSYKGDTSYLLCNICDDDQKRIGQVEEKPPLDWLDAWGAGQGGGDGEVDGGQHHHAGDVYGDNHVKL